MRNLIDKLILLEASVMLSASQAKNRFPMFIDHIRNSKPFYTDDGTAVMAKAEEADRFQEMFNQGLFRGAIKIEAEDGTFWPINSFLKTSDFGGQSIPPGKEEEYAGKNAKIGKETLLVKPAQINIVDKDFNITTMVNAIINNDILNSTEYGKVIIELTRAIINGEKAIIPPEFRVEGMKNAIVDNAGEYLGVIALVSGHSDFSKKKEFLEWLGGDLKDLTLRFPREQNFNIADSFASLTNSATEHQINISSKGTGGGAAPSLDGLKIPDVIRKKKSYATAVEFIELCQRKDLPKPITVSQVFFAMNLLNERVPKSIPEEFNKFLPWDQSIHSKVMNSLTTNESLPEYEELWQGIKFKDNASDGGKLTYFVKKTVIDIVNDGAIPNFEAAILEILDYNFIQQYTSVSKSGELIFTTQWPAKIDGVVILQSKSYAASPTKGGFSFKLKPKGSKAEVEGPESVGGEATPPDITTLAPRKTRTEITPTKEPKKPPPESIAGRSRR